MTARPSPFSQTRVLVLHLWVLTGFALFPIYQALSSQAEFLVAHDVQPVDLMLFVVMLSVIVPAGLAGVVLAAAKIDRRAVTAVQYTLLAILVAEVLLPVLKNTLTQDVIILPAALSLGIAFSWAWGRLKSLRMFLTFLAPSVLIFPSVFLFTLPVRDLLFPREGPASSVTSGNGAPVVLIVLDELPLASLLDASGQVNPERYPNLSALSQDSHWFRNAITVSQSTVEALPAILTGRLPGEYKLATAQDHPENLLSMLRQSGYEIRALEAVSQFYRDDSPRPLIQRFDALATDSAVVYLHLLLPGQLTALLPSIDAGWEDFGGLSLLRRLKKLFGLYSPPTSNSQWRQEALLEFIQPGPGSTVHFLHLMLPHLPWKYLPSGKEYGHFGIPPLPEGLTDDEVWVEEDWPTIQAWQRHLLQMGFTDRLLGSLLAPLKAANQYDSALIVIVGDHGASFKPGVSRRGLFAANQSDILNVPLFVKLPGQSQGVVSDRLASVIDILPTIAEALEVPLPRPVDGRSLLGPGQIDRMEIPVPDPERPGSLSITTENLSANRRVSLARQTSLFGESFESLYKIGDFEELIGQPVASFPLEAQPNLPGSEIEAGLYQHHLFEDVDPAGVFIPAFVRGWVRPGRPQSGPLDLAIAVNGVLRAATKSSGTAQGEHRFSAMVPEGSFQAGSNRVEVFETTRSSRGVSLHPLSLMFEDPVELGRTDDGEEILRPGVPPIPVGNRRLEGASWVDYSNAGPRVFGWVAAPKAGDPPEEIAVFLDGIQVFVAPLDFPEERAELQQSERNAGFQVSISQYRDKLEIASGIRIFAILEGEAVEIPFHAEDP